MPDRSQYQILAFTIKLFGDVTLLRDFLQKCGKLFYQFTDLSESVGATAVSIASAVPLNHIPGI